MARLLVLRSNLLCQSCVYVAEDSGLLYDASFRLVFTSASNDRTRLEIHAVNPQVYNGRFFGYGPCGFGWFHRREPVDPTSVEEYTILRYIHRESRCLKGPRNSCARSFETSSERGAEGVSVKVLALDLERTLVDDAMSANPRPGLLAFLQFCHERFGRVALFTTVETAAAREVLEGLARNGHVPSELLRRLEYVEWSGEHKDLKFVTDAAPGEVRLVDDDPGWVRSDQRGQWVPVAAWDGGPDRELARVRAELEKWLADSS